MPKISEYADLGTPQGAEKFVVARGGTTKKLSWDTIKAYLTTKYLGYGLGVTTGNSHAHVGGRGAQIMHHILDGAGSYTHAVIDSYIAGVGRNWQSVIDDDGYASYSTILAASDLVFTGSAGVWYAVRGRIWFSALTGDSFEFKFSSEETREGIMKIVAYPPNSIVGTTYIEVPGAGSHNCVGENSGGGYIEIDGIIRNTSLDGQIAFYFAMGAGSTYGVAIGSGSYIEYMLIG